ncbi:MAG: DUF2182 domain-containing protein [Pseudomonadota bacterium]|nr:DUF2182 domain-containing protein [Pseudomonadota bacterium]
MLEAALRQQRWLIGAAVLVLTALAWAYTIHLAREMSAMNMSMMGMSMQSGGAMDAGAMLQMHLTRWSFTDVATHFVMWAVMMVAMMLPSATPAILLFLRAAGERRDSALTPATLFILGYLASWTLFSAAATAFQWLLHDLAFLSGSMSFDSRIAAGTVLIAAGTYQWTTLKYNCLRHCQSPIGFLFGHWKDGLMGAFQMGLLHGLYCVGCCWLLMLLLFVVGVMNLAWVAGIAIYVLAEKIIPVGPRVARAAGIVVFAWGVLLLAGQVSV